jgi:hypothetical protein
LEIIQVFQLSTGYLEIVVVPVLYSASAHCHSIIDNLITSLHLSIASIETLLSLEFVSFGTFLQNIIIWVCGMFLKPEDFFLNNLYSRCWRYQELVSQWVGFAWNKGSGIYSSLFSYLSFKQIIDDYHLGKKW